MSARLTDAVQSEIAMQYLRWRVFMSDRCLIALAVGAPEQYELLGEQAKLLLVCINSPAPHLLSVKLV